MADQSSPVRASAQAMREIAEQIIRNHELLCDGIHNEEAPYCSVMGEDEPLCEACSTLRDAIIAALTAAEARGRQQAEQAVQASERLRAVDAAAYLQRMQQAEQARDDAQRELETWRQWAKQLRVGASE